MKKKQIKTICLIFSFFIFLGIDLGIGISVKADNQVVDDNFHIGPWARYENLQYGFSTANEFSSTGYPDIQMIQNDEIIDHIYKYRSNIYPTKNFTTSGFNLFSGRSPSNWTRSFQTAIGFNQYSNFNFSASSITSIPLANGLTAIKGYFVTSGFLVTCTMWPNTETRNITTAYTITNQNRSTQTIYPAKGLDTELNDLDSVPLYSRGVNQGIYMTTENTPGYGKYRMDYVMDYGQPTPELSYIPKTGPTPYYGAGFLGSGYGKILGRYNDPSKTQMNES